MGTVYRAEQLEPVQRTVALKILKRGMDTEALLTRFEAERQVLARMDSHHIARVFDAGATADGRLYFAMEYVDGLPITHFCDTYRLSIEERIRLLQQVCLGAQHAHNRGVLHRDLKPGNVLVTVASGQPMAKIIDFGVARAIGGDAAEAAAVTGHGIIVGTPEYMSPEQATGAVAARDLDTRTDVWSLGVLLFELLTGLLPYRAGERQRFAVPPRPSVARAAVGKRTEFAARRRLEPRTLARRLHGDLDWIVVRALASDREDRYASPLALHADLDRHLRHRVVMARPPSLCHRLRLLVRRNRAAAVVASVTVVLAVMAVLALWQQGQRIAVERGQRIGGLLAQAQAAIAAVEQAQAQGAWRLRTLCDRVDAAVAAGRAAQVAAGELGAEPARAAARLCATAEAWHRDVTYLAALDEALLEPGFGSDRRRSQRRAASLGGALAAYGLEFEGDPWSADEPIRRVTASRLRPHLQFAISLLHILARECESGRAAERTREVLTAVYTDKQQQAYLVDFRRQPERLRAALAALEPEVVDPLEAAALAIAMDRAGLGELADAMLQRIELLQPASFELRDGCAMRAWAQLISGPDAIRPTLAQPTEFARLEAIAKAAIVANPERRGGWFHWLRLLTVAKDPRAVVVGRRACRLFPDDPALLYFAAMALHDAGQAAESLANLRRLVAIEPDDAWGRYLIALASDDADEQRQQLSRAVVNDPYLVEVVTADARFLLQHEEPATVSSVLAPLLGAEPLCRPAHELAAAAARGRQPTLLARHLALLTVLGDATRLAEEVDAVLQSGDAAHAADRALVGLAGSGAGQRDQRLWDLLIAAERAAGSDRTEVELDRWLGGAELRADAARPAMSALAAARAGDWSAVAATAAVPGDVAASPATRLAQATLWLTAGQALQRDDLQQRAWELVIATVTAMGADPAPDARLAEFLQLVAWLQGEPQRAALLAARAVAAGEGGAAPAQAMVLRAADACVAATDRIRPVATATSLR